jgi:hypothetical protein
MVEAERTGRVSEVLLVEPQINAVVSAWVEDYLALVVLPVDHTPSGRIGVFSVEKESAIQAHWLPVHVGKLMEVKQTDGRIQCFGFWQSR